MFPVMSLAIRPTQCKTLCRAIRSSKTSRNSMLRPSSIKRVPNLPPIQKKRSTTFAGNPPGPRPGNPASDGPLPGRPAHWVAVAQLEILVRTAVFKTANELVGWMLQQAVDRIDAAYQPKPGEERKGRDTITAQGIFGHFPLNRDYYYHPG